jgi:hypothetical protein
MAQFQQQLLAYLPPAVRSLFFSGPGQELLNRIDTTLLVHGDQLLHVESGDTLTIARDSAASEAIESRAAHEGATAIESVVATGGSTESSTESSTEDSTEDSTESLKESSTASVNASALAITARHLLKGGNSKEHKILLLIAPSEFVATTQSMPGITPDNLASALELQTESLLPAYEQQLALAVNPGSAEIGDEHIALWLPQARLDEFFTAFSQEHLQLAAIKPRLAGISPRPGQLQFIDYDERGATAITLHDDVLQQWAQISALDLQQPEFLQQWQQQISVTPEAATAEYRSVADYSGQSDGGKVDKSALSAYSFFPAGALNARRRVEQGRKAVLAAALLFGVMLLAAIPFIIQSVEYRRAASLLASNRSLSAEARQDQAVVVGFENEWGPINDYPRQNIGQAMFTLQQALSPDQLSSLEISEGLIRIQGSSEDPQAILQRLEQDPLFTEVVFSRATNNTRYYIDLRLSPVNFEGYMLRYFPDE